MLPRRANRSRTERYVRRRSDETRLHGRRRGYDHARFDCEAFSREQKASSSATGYFLLAGVLFFCS